MVKKTNNVKEPATQCPEPTQIESVLCVVIPYFKDFHKSDMLRLAIRSWRKYFQEKFEIVVIGDKEDWFDDSFRFFPLTPTSNDKNELYWQCACYTLGLDFMEDDFVFAEPNSFLLNPTSLSHIALPKHGLAGNGSVDYCVGLPFCMSKLMLSIISKDFKDGFPKKEIENIYIPFMGYPISIQLDWKNDIWILPVVSQRPDIDRLNDFACRKLFMYAYPEGCTQFLLDWLDDYLK